MKRIITKKQYDRIKELYDFWSYILMWFIKFAVLLMTVTICYEQDWGKTWLLVLCGICLVFPVFEYVRTICWQFVSETLIVIHRDRVEEREPLV